MATSFDVQRLMGNVRFTPYGCWEWTGPLTRKGYGTFSLEGKSEAAHRASYKLLVGDIPEGLQLDHLCCNPCCVLPEHLEPVTATENVRRSRPRRPPAANHCRRGHEMTPENSYVRANGVRSCRECQRQRDRELYRERFPEKPRTNEFQRAKTHCPQGHPYEGDNLAMVNGMRQCKECRRERARERYRADHPGFKPAAKFRETCPKGHPYEGDNLYISPRGDRNCRECIRQAALDYYHRRKTET